MSSANWQSFCIDLNVSRILMPAKWMPVRKLELTGTFMEDTPSRDNNVSSTWHKHEALGINIKMLSCQYRKYHCGYKTVIWSSYLHNGMSNAGKMSSLYWIRALVLCNWVDLLLDRTGRDVLLNQTLFDVMFSFAYIPYLQSLVRFGKQETT